MLTRQREVSGGVTGRGIPDRGAAEPPNRTATGKCIFGLGEYSGSFWEVPGDWDVLNMGLGDLDLFWRQC